MNEGRHFVAGAAFVAVKLRGNTDREVATKISCQVAVSPVIPSPRVMKMLALCLFMATAMAAVATEKLLDDGLASRAEVVMRVKRLSPGEGSKYWWYRVQVLEVLKNQSTEKFTGALSVAAYSGKDGVPEGESTLYLERYNKNAKGLWKLVGGEAATGVSHVRKP
jgi:hypothetical protein